MDKHTLDFLAKSKKEIEKIRMNIRIRKIKNTVCFTRVFSNKMGKSILHKIVVPWIIGSIIGFIIVKVNFLMAAFIKMLSFLMHCTSKIPFWMVMYIDLAFLSILLYKGWLFIVKKWRESKDECFDLFIK